METMMDRDATTEWRTEKSQVFTNQAGYAHYYSSSNFSSEMEYSPRLYLVAYPAASARRMVADRWCTSGTLDASEESGVRDDNKVDRTVAVGLALDAETTRPGVVVDSVDTASRRDGDFKLDSLLGAVNHTTSTGLHKYC
jgi:hypothetical protein